MHTYIHIYVYVYMYIYTYLQLYTCMQTVIVQFYPQVFIMPGHTLQILQYACHYVRTLIHDN